MADKNYLATSRGLETCSDDLMPRPLFPLAAAGQMGVERALDLMKAELERDMKLMGCTEIGQLSRDNLRFR